MDIKELNVKTGEKRHHPWEKARARIILFLLKKYKKNFKSVVDIGCGDCFFLQNFSEVYPEVKLHAVDSAFDESLAGDLKLKISNLETYNNIEEVKVLKPIDVVFLMDVLEHIKDDDLFLSRLKQNKNFSKETFFVITVPAFNKLYCSHDKWLGHYRRYSPNQLRQIVKNTGFKYVSSGSFFMSLLFVRVIQKLYERFINKTDNEVKGVGDWKGGFMITFLYEKILLIDFLIAYFFSYFGIKLPGLSTYIICK
ncbi:MAG: class I SAM-dependent methyltransferase [Bacteroidales bacterium]|nr:class I SAM-dependent methyltransferase [Bacteroidales bacterium]